MTQPIGSSPSSIAPPTQNIRQSNKKYCALESCNKKIPLSMQTVTCKCNRVFCDRHRPPTQHSCGFNYHEHGKQILQRDLVILQKRKGTFDSKPGRDTVA